MNETLKLKFRESEERSLDRWNNLKLRLQEIKDSNTIQLQT
jgi:hypothetical protein